MAVLEAVQFAPVAISPQSLLVRVLLHALFFIHHHMCVFFFSACTHSVILSQAAKVREMDPAEISQD